MRVVADHIRTIAFAITDGQLPSNAKAGYVIRRILRRAVRYGYTFLNQRTAFMFKLIPQLVEDMGIAYPELKAQQTLIEKVIKEEEEAFLRTLETGIRLLDKVMDDARKANNTEISAKDTFTLYDTFGFPLDLTELILRENGFTANEAEFNAEMQKQKERARNAAAVETGDWVVLKEGDCEFVGYDLTECETDVLRYRKVKQKNNEFFQIVLSRTPFYAEMGGQVGDSGWLGNVEVFDTKRENNLAVHLCKQLPNDIEESLVAKINIERRQAAACNHSATHLLHESLREVLGNHVEQKGSFVSPDALRFDFSHFQKLTDEELRQVEMLANRKIRANFSLEEHRDTPIEEAKAMGAMALFGEKYGDSVRVIKFGESVELCGGTHVNSTGEIGLVRIVNEGSVAAGVRRIEAVTAEVAERAYYHQCDQLKTLKQFFNNAPDLVQAVHKSIEENAGLKKQIENFIEEKAVQMRQTLLDTAFDINGVKVARFLGEASPEIVRSLVAFLKGKFANEKFVFVAGTTNNDKPSITIFLSQLMVDEGYNAVNMVREVAKEIQGGGGGQPFMAQAGGKNPDGLNVAVDKILKMI
jgi:alanyl-tRNA synthetase